MMVGKCTLNSGTQLFFDRFVFVIRIGRRPSLPETNEEVTISCEVLVPTVIVSASLRVAERDSAFELR